MKRRRSKLLDQVLLVAPIVLWVLALTVATLAFASLQGCVQPSRSYVAADVATYNSIGREFYDRVQADSTLGPKGKEARFLNLDSWRFRTLEGAKVHGLKVELFEVFPEQDP